MAICATAGRCAGLWRKVCRMRYIILPRSRMSGISFRCPTNNGNKLPRAWPPCARSDAGEPGGRNTRPQRAKCSAQRRRRRATSPFKPVSPYGEAKLLAHEDFVKGYREKHGLFICSGILLNHESPRRGGRLRHAQNNHFARKNKTRHPNTILRSAILMRNATGVSPEIMSKRCS